MVTLSFMSLSNTTTEPLGMSPEGLVISHVPTSLVASIFGSSFLAASSFLAWAAAAPTNTTTARAATKFFIPLSGRKAARVVPAKGERMLGSRSGGDKRRGGRDQVGHVGHR